MVLATYLRTPPREAEEPVDATEARTIEEPEGAAERPPPQRKRRKRRRR